MLVVEQGRTIDSQRFLIKELFRDSTELTGLKSSLFQKQRAQAQAQDLDAKAAPTTAAIPARVENSVVKIFSTLRRPDPYKPWTKMTPQDVTGSGVVIEGNVDLAFDADGHVVVIDFKTDRELEGAVETYRRQVQIYAHAIALATGRPTRGVLMKV